MEVYAQRVAGIDIGKAELKACVRTPGRRRGTFHQEVRTFTTTTAGLLCLRDWLQDQDVRLAGMESTGQYWKPVYYMLETVMTCWLVNPQHIKVVPGRKSDVNDAMWIAQLTQFGLVRPSFVPPPAIRRLRDLTRLRTTLTREQTRHTQRIHDVLEDAMIKLTIVATDIMGVSGRAMLGALIAGERDPERLADLARGRMRAKTEQLTQALTGRFTDHHALQIRLLLQQFDTLQTAINELDTQIEAEITAASQSPDLPDLPDLHDLRDRLDTIPGIARRGAEILIAETGADMTRFPTPAHLSSWAGMCPGNNESAGKHRSTHTRKANPWLRGCLGEAAQSAARTKNTHIATRHRQLAGRRGTKRALVATGRHILESAWIIASRPAATYQDPGPDHRTQRTRNPNRRAAHHIQQLQALGYEITATPT